MANERNKTSLSDVPFNETLNDFGTERYVNGLIKFIENSSAPITIALQGEWGSGKTSLMTKLERALCSKDSSYIGVEINTWEYSMLSTPEETVFKIIERLVRALSQDDPQSKKAFNNFIKKAGSFLYRGGRESLKTIPGIGGLIAVGLEAANVPTDLPDSSSDSETVTLSQLKQALEISVKKIIEENHKKGVIVFVDDLDRLNPPVAVEILELLKNIFSIEDCIFILAIDYDVVVKGLEPKFGKLNDKNEREFRSFFDKIIQVPFTLPVSSYRPMNFVLDSLVKIGYITGVEKGDDRFKIPFSKIVESSVGKNPRSIKRLINTLSLLSCISQCGEENKKEFTDSINGRIANFAVVALQVCYPKIYKMLAFMPNLNNWDERIAEKYNINVSLKEDESIDWESILEVATSTDQYLSQHHNDIRNLLLIIQKSVSEDGTLPDLKSEENLRSLIDKSSVTGLNEPTSEGELNQKRLIDMLHHRITDKIKKRRPEINKIQLKRNTGNGGFYLFLDDKNSLEVILRPNPNGKNNKIALEVLLATWVRRTPEMMGKPLAELMEIPTVRKIYEGMDKVMTPLLQNTYYFEGKTYPESGLNNYFKSFSEEHTFRDKQGWMPQHVAQGVSYWINLANESLFSDNAIIETLTDSILAAYDLRLEAKKLYQ